jgi:hypothetical protein
MSTRFAYKPLKTGAPVWPLGGRTERPKPLVLATVIGPAATRAFTGLLDTGADDTVLPEQLAALIGLDLTNAPAGRAVSVAGNVVPVRYGQVKLRLTDGQEFREWPAWVAFTAAPLGRPLLGFAGCLQFFDANFRGAREEVELTVNALYPGT